MRIIEINSNDINLSENKDVNLVLGYFDGVHVGHQKMIEEALKRGDVGIMTFDISPSFILGKSAKYSHITSLFDKANIFKELGVKYLYILRANKELLNLSKEEFIEKILKPINPNTIFVGADYHFGKGASGDATDLAKEFQTVVFGLVAYKGNKISSRFIRDLITNGNVKEANEYLGHPYQVTGLVVEGAHNGEKIGFPTANLELTYPYVLPKLGVYAGYAKVFGHKYKALISMSTHPTIMELNDPIIEVHLLSYSGDLYGKEIEVQFIEYIRDIQKFDSLEDLADQLVEDTKTAKSML